jgi:hypothetical protein
MVAQLEGPSPARENRSRRSPSFGANVSDHKYKSAWGSILVFFISEGLRYAGLGGKANYDETFIKGNPSEGKVCAPSSSSSRLILSTCQFVAYYFKDNKVAAICSMGNDPIMSKTSELMRLGLMPSAQEIKGGIVSLLSLYLWILGCGLRAV